MDLVAPPGAAIQSGAAGATSPSSTHSPEALRAKVQEIPNLQVRQALTTLIDAAGEDVNRVRLNIEDWFNSSMDRVSGWYKRRSHKIVLVLGFLVAIIVNADSVLIMRKLASDRPLRDSIVAEATAYAQQNATSPVNLTRSQEACCPPSSSPSPTPKQTPAPTCWTKECEGNEATPQCKLKNAECRIQALGLPIGWNSETDPRLNWGANTIGQHLKDHIVGWLLTGLAISLGAPFWFDLLNKFIVIRSTVKPKEKSPEEKSKD
jgi:hypothetical protein